MNLKNILSFQEFKQGLLFRSIVFAFMGIGWDLCMTFLQQSLSGKINHNGICPVSVWMLLAYGTVPFFFYPLVSVTKHFRFHYVLRLVVLLAVFYAVELIFGLLMRSLNVLPWNYDWYLEPAWTIDGIITWHPAILGAWIICIMLVEWIDTVLRVSYPKIRENLSAFWKDI